MVAKYPVLDRWLPEVERALPTTVFEPSPPPGATPVPTPQPEPTPTPAPTAPPVEDEPEGVATPSPEPGGETITKEVAVELVVGSGKEATLGHTVDVRYRPAPAEPLPTRIMLGAGDVDAALDRAIQGMRVGGKRQLGSLEIELRQVL